MLRFISSSPQGDTNFFLTTRSMSPLFCRIEVPTIVTFPVIIVILPAFGDNVHITAQLKWLKWVFNGYPCVEDIRCTGGGSSWVDDVLEIRYAEQTVVSCTCKGLWYYSSLIVELVIFRKSLTVVWMLIAQMVVGHICKSLRHYSWSICKSDIVRVCGFTRMSACL